MRFLLTVVRQVGGEIETLFSWHFERARWRERLELLRERIGAKWAHLVAGEKRRPSSWEGLEWRSHHRWWRDVESALFQQQSIVQVERWRSEAKWKRRTHSPGQNHRIMHHISGVHHKRNRSNDGHGIDRSHRSERIDPHWWAHAERGNGSRLDEVLVKILFGVVTGADDGNAFSRDDRHQRNGCGILGRDGQHLDKVVSPVDWSSLHDALALV